MAKIPDISFPHKLTIGTSKMLGIGAVAKIPSICRTDAIGDKAKKCQESGTTLRSISDFEANAKSCTDPLINY
jgi:hypothetical protein